MKHQTMRFEQLLQLVHLLELELDLHKSMALLLQLALQLIALQQLVHRLLTDQELAPLR